MAEQSLVGKLSDYYDLGADVRYKHSHIPIRQLVTPNNPDIKALAAILHQAPDFPDACWTFVSTYTHYGIEEDDYWSLPAESLAKAAAGQGIDCDCSSILLVSLLRNYIPAERVFCAIVMWNTGGSTEGHMTVILQDSDGNERILESTAPPTANLPGSYQVYALFNDKYTLATRQGLDLFDLRPVVKEANRA